MCTDNNKISQDIPCWTSNVTALFYPLNHQLLNKKTFWTARKLSGSVSSHLVSPGSMGAGAQPCSTLCCPVDCSPPGSSVHRILRARPLQWAASLLQGIFLTQGFNHCRWIFYSRATGALGLLCWVCLFSPTCWQNPTSPWPLLSSEWGPKVSIYADGLTYLDTDADAQTQPSGHDPAGHVPCPCPSNTGFNPGRGRHSVRPSPPSQFPGLTRNWGPVPLLYLWSGPWSHAKILLSRVSHPNTPPSRFYFWSKEQSAWSVLPANSAFLDCQPNLAWFMSSGDLTDSPTF